jgi:hypothetical protein
MKKYLFWIPLGILLALICAILLRKVLPPWNLSPLERMAQLRTSLSATGQSLGKLKETLTIEEARKLCNDPLLRVNLPNDFSCQ